MFSEVLLFAIGLALICAGGDRLLNAAVSVSAKIGIPQIVVGATIVSLCTTLPEMMVSTTAIFSGSAAITVGNAIGSVICNTGLIAGIALLFSRPINMNTGELLWRCFFFMAVLIGLMAVAYIFGYFSTPAGLVLICLFIAYTVISIRYSEGESPKARDTSLSDEGSPAGERSLAGDLIIIGICAVFLFLGSRLLVTHGISIARLLGVPERAIAVTAIALGTSLPELVTTILALIRHYESISIGNVIGANILNLLLVIGIPSVFARVELESQTIFIDMPLALLVMIILTVPILIRKKSSRLQGAVLLAIYLIYCVTVL